MAKRSGRIPHHLVKTDSMLQAVFYMPQEVWYDFFNQFKQHELVGIASFMGINVNKCNTVEELINRITYRLKNY